MLGGLFLANFVLVPIVKKVLTVPPTATDKDKWVAIVKAASLFVAYASVMVYNELDGMDKPNYFQVLEINRDASQRDIKTAYHRLSKIHHPDVSDHPNANEMFMMLGKAKEILSKPSTRNIYDRFGERFMENPNHDMMLENSGGMLFVHFGNYLQAVIVIFIMSLSNNNSRSRWWSIAILMVVGFYEMMMKYDDESWDYLNFLLPSWTIYEKVELLHDCSIYLFYAISAYGEMSWVDMDALRFDHLVRMQQNLNEQQTMIMGEVMQMKEALAAKGIKQKGADGEETVIDGQELKRRQKVKEHLARGNVNTTPVQKKKETNYMSLLITGFMIYSWYTQGSK